VLQLRPHACFEVGQLLQDTIRMTKKDVVRFVLSIA